ncbi:MAG: response regulator [Alphaproteobacteria bacterium]
MARVLVVDDDAVLREMMREQLEGAGHEAVLAKHGGEALAAAEKQAFAVAVVDLFMPVVEGFETIRRLRRMQPHICIIAVTGGPQVTKVTGGTENLDYLEVARLLGARHTLHKPFRGAALVAAVADCLGR